MVDLGRQLLATGMQCLGMRREDRNLVELLLTSIQSRVFSGASSGISARESRKTKRRHDSVSGNGGSAEGGGIQSSSNLKDSVREDVMEDKLKKLKAKA